MRHFQLAGNLTSCKPFGLMTDEKAKYLQAGFLGKGGKGGSSVIRFHMSKNTDI